MLYSVSECWLMWVCINTLIGTEKQNGAERQPDEDRGEIARVLGFKSDQSQRDRITGVFRPHRLMFVVSRLRSEPLVNELLVQSLVRVSCSIRKLR